MGSCLGAAKLSLAGLGMRWLLGSCCLQLSGRAGGLQHRAVVACPRSVVCFPSRWLHLPTPGCLSSCELASLVHLGAVGTNSFKTPGCDSIVCAAASHCVTGCSASNRPLSIYQSEFVTALLLVE